MFRFGLLTAIALALTLGSHSATAQDRPNILWLTTEDMSATLGAYGDEVAVTPRIDRFAAESVRYTRAFATAPVCSPSRSCLITGVYATSLGSQRLRSSFPLPSGMRGFPEYLRAAGYFTTNNVKTDYNIADEQALIDRAWDRNGPDAHWRQRGEDQPFFSVFNFMITHQSRASVWSWDQFETEIARYLSPAERTDPADVVLPPYYPDTPLVRRTLARHYDCVRAMDRAFFGRLLDELEADGLADDTIVFFYSDHGSGLPRHKRLLHDSGMHVPLLVRFPPKYRHMAPAQPGETVGELVSFVDFAPTVLRLTGIDVPQYMQGRAFLPAGENEATRRRYVFGARDRVDEAYDLARSIRDRRWLYIRNYMPHLSHNQPEGYSDASDMRRELARLAAAGELNSGAMTYAGPRKPAVELYDTLADPYQMHNLATDRTYADVAARMDAALTEWMIETRDLGFLTDHEAMVRSGDRSPREALSDDAAYDLGAIEQAARLVGRTDAAAQQARLLTTSDDAAIRYWAAVGLAARTEIDAEARGVLAEALDDASPSVRIEAAGALLAHTSDETDITRAADVLDEAVRDDQGAVALHAARSIQMNNDRFPRDRARALKPILDDATARANRDFYRFYIQFALEPVVGTERWWQHQ